MVKIGSIVTMTIPRVREEWHNVEVWESSAGIVPTGYRPAARVTQVFSPADDSTYDADIMGCVTIASTGTIEFKKEVSEGGQFWDSATSGWDGFSVSWSID
jgi:hypothetical protein